MQGNRPQGSFGVPQNLLKDMEAARKKQTEDAEKPIVQEPVPVQEPVKEEIAAEKKPEDTQEDKALLEIQKTKEHWEKQLEIKITGEDVQDYLFKGRVTKEGVYLTSFTVKGVEQDFRVTFQSLTPEDSEAIDIKMAEYRDKGKYTATGLDNEQALVTLSHALLNAAGRPMGKAPEERYANIKRFGGHTVNLLALAWKGFNYLLDYSLQEKKLLKK